MRPNLHNRVNNPKEKEYHRGSPVPSASTINYSRWPRYRRYSILKTATAAASSLSRLANRSRIPPHTSELPARLRRRGSTPWARAARPPHPWRLLGEALLRSGARAPPAEVQPGPPGRPLRGDWAPAPAPRAHRTAPTLASQPPARIALPRNRWCFHSTRRRRGVAAPVPAGATGSRAHPLLPPSGSSALRAAARPLHAQSHTPAHTPAHRARQGPGTL